MLATKRPGDRGRGPSAVGSDRTGRETHRRVRRCIRLALLALLLAPGVRGAAADDAAWRARLAASDPLAVLEAVEDAGTKRDASASTALLDTGVATDAPAVAVACGRALALIEPTGPPLEALLAGVARAAKSKAPATLANLARVLGGWGSPAVDAALASLCLPPKPPAVQEEALHMAAAGGEAAAGGQPDTTAAIVAAMGSPVEAVRAAACDAAGDRRLVAATDRIATIVTKSPGGVDAAFAVAALERLGWTASVKSFVTSARRRRGPDADPSLRAVVRLSVPTDAPELRPLLRDRAPELRIAALLAVERMARRGTLAPALAPPAPEARDVALLLDDALDLVAADPDTEVRAAARRAVAAVGTADATRVRPRLAKWLGSTEEDVVLAALEAAGTVRDTPSFERCVELAIDAGAGPAVRQAAARAAGRIDPAAAVTRLSALAAPSGGSAATRSRAAWALGFVPDRAAIEALVARLSEAGSPAETSREVERALERLSGRRLGPVATPWVAWLARTPHPIPAPAAAYDRAELRRAVVAAGAPGVTAASERAVERGLLWMSAQQRGDGAWTGGPGAFQGYASWYTAYAVLAYTGAGYVERSGRHGETLRRALRYLQATQGPDGGPTGHFLMLGSGGVNAFLSERCFAPMWTAALVEAVAFGRCESAREGARAAIDFLDRVQVPGSGFARSSAGWQGTGQTVGSAWVAWATRAAESAGIPAPDRYRDGIDASIEAATTDATGFVEDPSDEARAHADPVGARMHTVVYTAAQPLPPSRRKPGVALREGAHTEMGVVVRTLASWPRWHPLLVGGGNYLREHPPRWLAWEGDGPVNALHSYWLWGAVAARALGGQVEREWGLRLTGEFVDRQRRSPPGLDGSWEGDGRRLTDQTDFYATVSIVLTLESGYRLRVP